MKNFLAHLGWFLSPTRKIIDLLKKRGDDPARRGKALRAWSFWFFYLEVFVCIGLMLLADEPPTNLYFVGWVVAAYAGSRINEIAYAFYSDALCQSKKSDLKIIDRIRMAMRSYFGLLFNFALLYYFLPIEGLFKAKLNSFLESFYFSGVTLATLGYGDVFPTHWVSRLLALDEVFTGILIIAVVIAMYIGGVKDENA